MKYPYILAIFTYSDMEKWASHVALLPMQGPKEMNVRSLDWEDFLEEGVQTHSHILAWRIAWTEEPRGYNLWGHKESDMTEVT